jgi:crotonobetainyl-CoA:carnitine CoA-transferase CaiB-like acyl-CoA transferase
MAGLPLDGIEILDVGTLTPGKYCSYLLADLGASVIRIERAVSDEPLSEEDVVLNRNKRSMVLDLRSADGREAMRRLADRCDVLLEANRPGVADRLGFGYDALKSTNPLLVYCSISAFGQDGPYRDRPAYDLIFMGMSGVWQAMLAGREPPPAPGLFLADAVTGLVAAFAIVTGVLQRERAGEGARIDLSMLESTFALLTPSHGLRRQTECTADAHIGPARVPGSSPSYRLYRAGDGQYIVLGAVRPASWRALCDLIGRPDLGDDPYPEAGRAAEAVSVLGEVFAQAPAQQWLDRLGSLDIDCGPYHSPAEACDDAQLRARGLLAQAVHPRMGTITRIGSPLATSFGGGERTEPPVIGEHTQEILREIGLSDRM